MTFFVTFGQRFRRELHPYFGHPDGYAEVRAQDKATAQAKVSNRYGHKWANLYTDAEFDKLQYPKGCIERFM